MPDAVERFRKLTGKPKRSRREEGRPPVPPREWALVTLLLINILWLSFALGGVRLWGEITALFLSLATLFLLPRWNRGEIQGQPSPVFTLLKLPLFWFGLGLFVYFWIQSWNLAWEWTLVPDAKPKLVSQTPIVPWLPSGLFSPFEESNPVRSMIYYTIPWIACCSAWAGLMTRRSVGLLLHGLAISGLLFAIVALRQHFLDLDRILGIFPTVPSKVRADIPFWGTLVNENHAAFYLILVNGLCLGLFLSGWHRDIRLFKKGGGAWMLYLGFGIVASFAALMAQARGAIGFLVLQWILFLIICSVFLVRSFGKRGIAFPITVVALMATLLLTFVVNPAIFERQKKEWIETFNLVENPELEARYFMTRIGWDMIKDKPWYGHGAGGWRYIHFPYKAKYPEFITEHNQWKPNPYTGKRERRKVTTWFQNAHVDLLEYVIEWGIVGCLFPLMAAGWLVSRAIRSYRGWDAGGLTILMTVLVVWLGAAVEFHFRIPLVLLAWCLAFTTITKLSDLQAP
ncbi:O-antigen ligase family protein [Puniceicoccales bacterium CK1056]|uniref:O-antigen ligase family protein n=1 Tax=Oceanipulchritudo coccoides TaxID=2706888 RepID=A0A6B2LWK9_9BACT|nr:O-antigen ligase family protein [Oceanipulchritudo coccoides]